MKFFSKSLLFSVLAAMFVHSTSYADFLIEPYLGYGIGKSKVTIATLPLTEEDTKGVYYGLRAGYSTAINLAFGAEFMMGNFEDEDLGATDEATKFTFADPGVFVSFDFPVLVRAFATYFPMAKVKAKDSSGTTDLEGNTMKLGVGLTWLPFLSINLEYMMGTYDTTVSGVKIEADMKTYGLSVSFPLEI